MVSESPNQRSLICEHQQLTTTAVITPGLAADCHRWICCKAHSLTGRELLNDLQGNIQRNREPFMVLSKGGTPSTSHITIFVSYLHHTIHLFTVKATVHHLCTRTFGLASACGRWATESMFTYMWAQVTCNYCCHNSIPILAQVKQKLNFQPEATLQDTLVIEKITKILTMTMILFMVQN